MLTILVAEGVISQPIWLQCYTKVMLSCLSRKAPILKGQSLEEADEDVLAEEKRVLTAA